MSDLLTRLESAQAFKDGTPFQTAALDKALRECVEALELINKSPTWSDRASDGNTVYHTYKMSTVEVAEKALAALARELESK